MVKILKAYGIPNINASEDTYHNTKAKVTTPDGDTDEFEILAGVLQGDTLAPYLIINSAGLLHENCHRRQTVRPWLYSQPQAQS